MLPLNHLQRGAQVFQEGHPYILAEQKVTEPGDRQPVLDPAHPTRQSVWEDAWLSGLVNVVVGDGNKPAVILTARGEAVLNEDKKPGQDGPVNR